MKPIFYIALLPLFFGCDHAKDNHINLPNYEALSRLDVKMDSPKDGDWLMQHQEKGQTFNQYVAKKPTRVNGVCNKIYLQPIGVFTPAERQMLELTAEYMGYFFGLETILLDPVTTENIPEDKKRFNFETQQLDASYIIHNILPKKMPYDGIVIMGLTAQDLYPNPQWNYVFGLASYKKRTAVTSMFRFADTGFGPDNYATCLNRLIKTSSHEIGHMFSLAHCIHAKCIMNGANHLVELDNSPNTLCSVCLAKLSWNLDFDNLKRMEKMISFCKRHKLTSDALILQQQLQVIKNS